MHVSMKRSKADSTRFVEQDLQFHQTLFRISGNRVCNMMFTVVHQSVRKLMALTATLVDPEHTLALHRRIITAIRKGAPEEARQRMIQHLEDATGLLARTAAKQTETRLLSRLSKLSVTHFPSGGIRVGGGRGGHCLCVRPVMHHVALHGALEEAHPI